MESYRYPPRLFSLRPIKEFQRDMSFEFRYVTTEDKNVALSRLDAWDATKPLKQLDVRLGSNLPALRAFFDAGKVVRGLTKIGVNLLAAYCPNPPVTPQAFPDVMRLVR